MPAVLRTRVVFFTGISGKIIVKWKAVRTEIEKITVSPDAIPLLCQVEQIEDPRERQLSQMELTESWKSRVAQADWLIPYYDHILERLNSGKLVKDVPGLEDPLFFLFLNIQCTGLYNMEWDCANEAERIEDYTNQTI